MNPLDRAVRAMTIPERRAYLLAAGWTRIGSTWLHPTREQPGGDRGFYTFGAAIRTALESDHQRQENP